MDKQVLVIDDEQDLRELLSITLSGMGLVATAYETIAEAKQALQEKKFDLCLTDMRLPDGNGIDLVDYTQKNYPHMPIALITAYGNVELAVNALKLGAFDFLSKPIELSRLRQLVDNALQSGSDGAVAEPPSDANKLLGDSSAMQRVRAQISKVARSQAPMFISGESGTGKELAARSIHLQSSRANRAFVAVNCGAIPGELMESEFFGHKKGSFTGATEDKIGLFQAANGGTLFLDEVADLPLLMQVKLLRAIQEKSVRAIGAEVEIDVDVRLMSATHKDLHKAVEMGQFRSDLFYRLNVIDIHMPSLRDRKEDIKGHADHIIADINNARTDAAPIVLGAEALDRLLGYDFPGNVRELENILERASTLCEKNLIAPEDLKLVSTGIHSLTKVSQTPMNSLDDHLDEIEKDMLIDALEKTQWNKTEAARKLGISFRSIRYRLKKLGLNED
jgi:two-component system response regulator PilR (NtrC family)